MVFVVQLPALQPGRRPAETPFPGRQRGRAGAPGRAAMAVDKDVLELDLYGLLGIGEKASEKEVRAGGGHTGPPPLSPLWASPPPPSPQCRAGGGWAAAPCCCSLGTELSDRFSRCVYVPQRESSSCAYQKPGC